MEQREHILSPAQLAGAVSESLAQNGSFVLTVTGGSMVPALLHGRSQVELIAPGELRPGHIVLAQRGNGSLVLHRVIQKNGEVLTLNGDAQSWTEQVPAAQVLGRVRRICRKGKWHDAETLPDKLYCGLWGLTRPLRPGIFRIYAKIKRK